MNEKPRCQTCGWPLEKEISLGCTAESCSMRPIVRRFQEAEKESAIVQIQTAGPLAGDAGDGSSSGLGSL
jgi:hypothetical protein